MRPVDRLQDASRRLVLILEDVGDQDVLGAALLVDERIQNPRSFVTLIGETSTGKSTLVNSLLGRKFIPASAVPTTAIVTEVNLVSCNPPTFSAIRADGATESLSQGTFEKLSRSGRSGLARLLLRADPADPQFRGLTILDTPGYNAILTEHEEALRDFIPQSDMVVLVCGYRTGFGQSDQDFVEVVGRVIREDPTLPVLLVVNRAPAGTSEDDARVQSMRRNVCDCVRRDVGVTVIESSTAHLDPLETGEETPLLDTTELWLGVKSVVMGEQHTLAVMNRMRQWLHILIRNVDGRLERSELLAEARLEDEQAIKNMLAGLEDAKLRSDLLIGQRFDRMAGMVPGILRTLTSSAKKRVEVEIANSDKWLGQDGCTAWVSQHAMPFEVRAVCRHLMEFIAAELERLDEELDHLANTAVKRVADNLRLRSDIGGRLAESLLVRFGQRGGGFLIMSALKGFGGVGGAAAGAGNLAKMVVKNAGRVFSKTFSRGLYNQIGRTFTRRALQRASVIVAVLIEAAIFIREANVWKGRLKKTLDDGLSEWEKETVEALLHEHLPQYKSACQAEVGAWYQEEIGAMASDGVGESTGKNESRKRLQDWRKQLRELTAAIDEEVRA
jgi:GTPase SAR1 family protein